MTAVDDMLGALGAADAVSASRTGYLLAQLAQSGHWVASEADYDLAALAGALEALAQAEEEPAAQTELYLSAFLARRRVLPTADADLIVHLAHLASDGLLAQRNAEVLMLLRSIDLPAMETLAAPGDDFADHLLARVLRGYVLLVRRGHGWDDVRAASDEIRLLREEHERAQQELTVEAPPTADGEAVGDVAMDGLIVERTIRLIAGFNLARIVDIAATYTATGTPANADLALERHAQNLVDLSRFGGTYAGLTADLVVAGCRQLVRSSIWQGTGKLGSAFRSFVAALASPDRADPVLELWPSQRTALDQHLLDPARRAVVVEMPTSAGKTLLAEFSIVQARALNPESAVAYVVPTRALVNQITQRLRADLRALDLIVEAAVPVFDLDPTEDILLRDRVDVLVCTPEKLDLLLKADHPSIRQLSLVVMDEAHNIGDDQRGVRMEMLLGAIKRERRDARFLLLTPFVPNGGELAAWLGDGADATIQVRWRPSERVAATAHWPKERGGDYVLTLTTVASADNVDVPAGHTVPLARSAAKLGKTATTVSLALTLATRGSVLVLARGRVTAEVRAAEIAAHRSPSTLSELGTAVQHYAQSELGEQHGLPAMLARRVTFHHAALSHDLRFLLEQLIDAGDVDIVCGTTTLAQGLNFPISSVVIETRSKSLGIGKGTVELSHSEFWNIAGRAGRALRDPLGLVVFPALTKADRTDVADFLVRDAAAIASALMEAAVQAGAAVQAFDLKFVRNNPSLSVFLQYLLHATRVAGAEQTAAELEEILRSSLVYHQAQRSDRELASRLLDLSRRFVSEVANVDRGFLALADGTGFSLPSARYVFARSAQEHPEFRDKGFWEHDHLFGSDLGPLTSVVEVLAAVPEMSLGVTEDAGAMNAQRVAGIMSDWVAGASISAIGERWFAELADTPLERARAASRYVYSRMTGQLPWGLGALQRLLLPSVETDEEDPLARARHIPAMVFYGVPNEHAAVMRMSGVPRIAADALGGLWHRTGRQGTSFADVRRWIASLSPETWAHSLPQGSPLSGDEAGLVWRRLTGQ